LGGRTQRHDTRNILSRPDDRENLAEGAWAFITFV
jgi:hypothetical protein